jgi:hypothetical protein
VLTSFHPAQAKKVWDTLKHRGVTFPPPYVPHGVKLLYDGEEVDLSPEEEEVRWWPCVPRSALPPPPTPVAVAGLCIPSVAVG